MTNRRTFLAGAAATALVRGAAPVATASAVLLSTQPAHAIEPITVIAVAQAGVALWKMAKGGGPGTASLLRQQTEMLRAISDQLRVVDSRLQLIYGQLERLKDAVDQLPSNTVREFYVQTLSGAFVRASELMKTAAAHRERFGIAYAIQQVKDEASRDVLDQLRNARSVLINDASVAVVPLVCAAWYTEFQMMVSAVPYDRERIRSSAETYLTYINKRAQHIDHEIKTIEADASAAQNMTSNYGRYIDYACNTDIRNTSRRWSAGGGGGGGREGGGGNGPYEHREIKAEKMVRRLQSKPAPVAPTHSEVSETFNDIRGAGIDIPIIIDQLDTRAWTSTADMDRQDWGHHVEIDFRPYERQRSEWIAAAQAKSCDRFFGNPTDLASDGNRLTAAAELRALKALTHYSAKLCCRDAKASIESVMTALSAA